MANPLDRVDWLFTHAHLLTMEGAGVGYVPDGAVAVAGNRIAAVGSTQEVQAALANAGVEARRRVDAREQVILPGLVDAHVHTQLGLLRGVAQDMRNWMFEGLFPYLPELKPRWQLLSSQLTLIEALRAGTTTFADFLVLPGPDIFELYLQSGVRARPVLTVFEVGPGLLSRDGMYCLDPRMGRASFNEAMRLHAEYHGADGGRIQCMLGPYAPDLVSRDTLLRVRETATAKGLAVQMHLAQGDRETAQMLHRYGKRSIPFLLEHDYLGRDFTAVHMTDASAEEIHRVVAAGSSLVVCNGAIGLIDGTIPPAVPFQQAGGCVGLGSDQPAGNNNCNMFDEMKLAALFGKIWAKDPTAMPAEKVLRMATIEGARALGLAHEVGSIGAGKKADLVFVDARRPTLQPLILEPFNLAANLVYSARGDEVRKVMIDGKVVYEDGELKTIDETAVLAEIRDTVPLRRRKSQLLD